MEAENRLMATRVAKLEELKKEGIHPFPNDFRTTETTGDFFSRYDSQDGDALGKVDSRSALAGRIMAVRSFGKAAFIVMQDRGGRLQAYIRKDQVGDEAFLVFKQMDVGDFVGVSSSVFL